LMPEWSQNFTFLTYRYVDDLDPGQTRGFGKAQFPLLNMRHKYQFRCVTRLYWRSHWKIVLEIALQHCSGLIRPLQCCNAISNTISNTTLPYCTPLISRNLMFVQVLFKR
jgi:hypothetical protein